MPYALPSPRHYCRRTGAPLEVIVCYVVAVNVANATTSSHFLLWKLKLGSTGKVLVAPAEAKKDSIY